MSTIPEGTKRTHSTRGDGAVVDAVRSLIEGTPATETKPAPTPPATPTVETPALPDPGQAIESAPPADGKGSDFLAQLEAAMSGESPDAPTDNGNPEKGEVPLGLTGIADAMQVSESELFKMPISMPDGAEPQTLGQLKDAATELNRTRAEVETFYQQREVERNEMAQARGELEAVVAMIPAEMRTPQMLAAARERMATVREGEARKMVERVPEWASAETRQADMTVIGDHIGKWGFNSTELASIVDHRMLAYVRHNALQEQRLNVLLGKSKAKPKQGGKPQRGKGQEASSRTVTANAANAMQHGNRSQQAQALGDLLRSRGVTL